MALANSAPCRPSTASHRRSSSHTGTADTIRLPQYPLKTRCNRRHSDGIFHSLPHPDKRSVVAAPRPASSRDEAAAYLQTASQSAFLVLSDASPQDLRFDTIRIAPPFPPQTTESSSRHPPRGYPLA